MMRGDFAFLISLNSHRITIAMVNMSNIGCQTLARVSAAKVHEPWQLLPIEQERFGVRIGVDYPQPVVDLFKSAKNQ